MATEEFPALPSRSHRTNRLYLVSRLSLKTGVGNIPGILLTGLLFLKPSFLDSPKPRKLHPTSYLDGLRGVAALFVVFAHYQATYFPYLGVGWHQITKLEDGSLQENNYIVQFPIIRTFYAPRFMLAVFFVISGYVLSAKSLGLARRREWLGLMKSLASSVFRRFLRLMLPALAASFLCFLLASLNLPTGLLKGWDDASLPSADLISKIRLSYNPDSVTISDWFQDATVLIDPFKFGDAQFPKYDFPLWTMPVEYMGSMIVFVTMLGTAFLRPILRSILLGFLVLYCLWSGHWHWTLFIGGILIADMAYKDAVPVTASYLPLTTRSEEVDSAIDEEEEDSEKQPPPSFPITSFQFLESYSTQLRSLSLYLSLRWHIFCTLIFVLALHIGSSPDGMPDEIATAPGFGLLSKFILDWGFHSGYCLPDIAALLLVFILSKAEFLQRIFTTRIAQYLGDISLSLYMLHVLILMTVGSWLVLHCLLLMRDLGSWGFGLGMTVAFIGCAVVTLWAADIFWRVIDKNSIRFTRWLEKKAFVKDR